MLPASVYPENWLQYKIVVSVLIGAILYWNRAGKGGRRSFLLLRSLTQLIPHRQWREAADMLVFVVIGCIIVLLVVEPSTPQQGFAAGLGWTGLLSEAASN